MTLVERPAHRSQHFYCDGRALRLPQLGGSRLLL